MDFEITKEMIEAAADYVPLVIKTQIAKDVAESCVQSAKETTGVKTDAGNILPLPPRYFCDEAMRSILEMSVFTTMYLHVEKVEEGQPVRMDSNTYDKYAGSHIFAQLNAIKSGPVGRDEPELKTKIIRMLADFNDFQKRLTSEVRRLMTVYNDPVDRFMAMNAALTTPETMDGLIHELKDAAEAIEEYKQEREGEGA